MFFCESAGDSSLAKSSMHFCKEDASVVLSRSNWGNRPSITCKFVCRFPIELARMLRERTTDKLNLRWGRVYQASKRASDFLTSWIRSLYHPKNRGLTAPTAFLGVLMAATALRS